MNHYPEDKVRRIAEEVMGYKADRWSMFTDAGSLSVFDSGWRWFEPHADAADRERVMMKVVGNFEFTPATDEHDYRVGINDLRDDPRQYSAFSPDPGLAFIDAVDAWLDAREAEKT